MKAPIFSKKIIILPIFLLSIQLFAQEGKQMFNPIATGVGSLGIAPDARGGGMGDLGAATSPDTYSQFWNASKYAFADSRAGLALSYTPWLRKLVSDIDLAYLSGYWKFGYESRQAVAASLRYFSLGEINQTDNNGATINTVSPYEMAADVSYSRLLSDKYSMAVTFRYILSDLATSGGNSDATPGSAFAADISGYFTAYPIIARNECQLSFGYNISNIGTKISYNGGNDNIFLPTNLRLGGSILFPVSDYNTLSFNIDVNKLLVPSGALRSNYSDDDAGTKAFEAEREKYNNMSPITGIFKSFYDAPGGFKEELREINFSVGAEYSYNQQFFLRAGYYHEDEYKGNRKYFTVGAGFSLNVFRLDAAYVISLAQSSPLDQTLRLSLSFDLDGLKELIGR